MHRLQELVRLHRLETGKRETARLLKMSPNTERPYREALEAADLLFGPVEKLPSLDVLKAAVLKHHPPKPGPQEVSSIEAWLEQVQELMKKGLKPRAIYDRLRLEAKENNEPFLGSYWAVKRLYKRLYKARGVQPEDIAIPVETGPAEVAQVDFGYVGYLYDPQTQKRRKAWVFVLVLGYSRHMWAKVVFDQRTETWLSLHVEAFAALGGCVETVVPDNLKAAVIRAAFAVGGETALNRSYRELARHYGFKVDPTPPYQPKKKGKVESGVRYVKGNFFVGRQGEPSDEVQHKLERWVLEIAGTRRHGTTGQAPLEVFIAVEQPVLQPLPPTRFEPVIWKQATVRDAYAAFDGRLYSVPYRLSDSKVWIRATAKSVMLYADDERAATHGRNEPGKRSTIEAHLPEGRRDLRHRSRDYSKVVDLATCTFIAQKRNAIFVGPTGVGKSHLAQAIGHRACRAGYTVLNIAAQDLFRHLRAGRADASVDRRLQRLAKFDLLICDDLGLRPLAGDEQLELYEVIRSRHERASTIVTSNRAVEELHALFADPLLAAAAMDRLLQNAQVITIEGDSHRNPPSRRGSRKRKGQDQAQEVAR